MPTRPSTRLRLRAALRLRQPRVQADHLDDLVADRCAPARARSSAPGRSCRSRGRGCRACGGRVGASLARSTVDAVPAVQDDLAADDAAGPAQQSAGSSEAVIDLPQPDSPTTQRVRLRWSTRSSPSTALHDALAGEEMRREVPDLEENRRPSRPRSLRVGIGGVAQAVAEEVEGEHGDDHGDARE